MIINRYDVGQLEKIFKSIQLKLREQLTRSMIVANKSDIVNLGVK